MKTEINTHSFGENNNIKKSQHLVPRLSDEAFYLIALAGLLKKEFGQASLKQYLVPGGLPVYKGNIAN